MMDNNIQKNKQIARNTLFLYFRMLFIMCISLYTSRVILEALGVSDYGIYNVVGGFVAMFALISSSLTSACTRFLNYEMGKGSASRLRTVFSTSLTVHIILACIIALLCESFGVWYVNNKMVIPEARLIAANWVFQISVLNFCINLVTVPFNAAIIAHEKMSTFACVSIFEGISRLVICFLVMWISFDHLITYALLYMLVQVSVMAMYQVYCNRHFDECHYRFSIDKKLTKQMFSYSGWHVFGNSASILNRQGVDLVLNLFCGTILNAAKGISNQVMNAVASFANNFMIALNPQITKSYAKGDYDYMLSLLYRGSRFSYYLLFFLSLPIILNTDYIMHIWLKNVPEYAVQLAQLSLVASMIASLSNPLVTAQNATGNVRNYQIVVGGLQLFNLPLCYIVLYMGFSPLSVMVVAIVVEILNLIARLIMIPIYINSFSSVDYLKEVILKILIVTIVASVVPLFLSIILPEGFLSFVAISIVCCVSSFVSILMIGCTRAEKQIIYNQMDKGLKMIKVRK